ncbi:MAG: non-canonical purine NTP pyrophosphatase [bacterium]|nr:non-canonical purine NTP pyrophosphatase [bacterium]
MATLTQLLIGTGNPGKAEMLQNLLQDDTSLSLKTLKDFPVEMPEETGTTFEENALLKAQSCAEQTELPCIGDDSGLVIPALGGIPGLRSARWFDEFESPAALFSHMESELKDKDHRAYFHCALAFSWPQEGVSFTVTGKAYGTLVFPPRGSAGFGYMSVFVPDEDPQGRTYAQLTAGKIIGHHRAIAGKQLVDKLIPYLPKS